MKRPKKILALIIAMILTCSVSVVAFASTPCTTCVPSAEINTYGTDYGRYAKVAAHRAAETAPLILGAELTTMQTNVTASTIDSSEVFNIFASGCNWKPAGLLNNYYTYLVNGTTIANDNNLKILQTTVAPMRADSNSVESRTDIYLGNAANGEYTYPSDLTTVAYDCDDLEDMISTMYALASEMNDAKGFTNATVSTATTSGRYGNPLVIANDYERYVKGTKYYILSQISTMKRVAVVGLSNNKIIAYKASTESGTAASCRGAEYLYGTTINVADYISTPSDTTVSDIIAQNPEYIFLVGMQGSSMTNQLLRDTYIAEQAALGHTVTGIPNGIEVVEYLPATSYGIVMNSVENALGVGVFQSIVYSEYIDMAEAAAYFYNDFYHVNICCMDSMIDDNFANMDEYDGEAYDDTDIDEAVAAYADYLNTGMEAYYDDEPISVPTGLEMSNNFSTSMTTYTPDTTHICPGTCACNSSEE